MVHLYRCTVQLAHQLMHIYKIFYIKTFKIAPIYFDPKIIFRELNCSLLKVKWSRYRPEVAQRGGGIEVYIYSSMTATLQGSEWSAARPGRTLPPEKTRYPFYRRLGGLQGRSGRVENFDPTGIRSRTVQPVVSRYTDWGTRPAKVTFLKTLTD